MDALYGRLSTADETGDTTALAGLAWELYGLLGTVAADLNTLRSRLRQALTTPA